MITHEQQYRVTRSAVERFEEALAHAGDHSAERHPLAQKLLVESIEGQLYELRAQMAEWEALVSGRYMPLDLYSLTDLPGILIDSRKAKGLTVKDLADCLGLDEATVEHYEASSYAEAGPERLQAVADALGVIFRGHVMMPSRLRNPAGSIDS